jgi:hypothetical protein
VKPAAKEPIKRNFDDEPIRGMKNEDLEKVYVDERPIKGISKETP